MYGIESIALSQIFEIEVSIDIQILKFPKSENHILKDWSLSVCL